MATEAQIAANRANARQSTGPKSRSGKRKSSRNALRHGLSARALVALTEKVDDFEDFRSAMRAELQPQGAVEEHLFERVVQAAWRLRRASRIEAALLGRGAESWHFRTDGKRGPFDEGGAFQWASGLDQLSRLEQAQERTFERAYALLRSLQSDRRHAEEMRRLDASNEEDNRASVLLATRNYQPDDEALPVYDAGEPSKHVNGHQQKLHALWARSVAMRGGTVQEDEAEP